MRWLLSFFLFSIASAAAAQTVDDPQAQPDETLTDSERAVTIGKTAMSLFKEERWPEAYDKFSEAETVAHSPVFLLYMARCKRQLGDLKAARALYKRVVDDATPQGAPESWKNAQAEAAQELGALFPRLRIAVRGGAAEVKLDGRTLTSEELAQPIEVEPGQHRVEARRGRGKPVVQQVTLARGSSIDVVLELPEAPSPERRGAGGDTPKAEPSEGSLAPGIVMLAFAGAAGIAGIVTGAIALDAAQGVVDRCTGDDCTGGGNSAEAAALQSDRDRAYNLAHASTASLVVAGVAAAVGITLLILRPGGGSEVGIGPGSLRIAFLLP
ncbi:MAG TPA: hypothetical protein VFB62_21490 [Polyangiaceae bacterium]|jgi:hypothetical protein|nr:hypothetical protein [Polyangiaceae bacterium]